MYAKLLTLIGAFGLTGLLVLCARHQRLQSTYRAATMHRLLTELEQTRWSLRNSIEDRFANHTIEPDITMEEGRWQVLLDDGTTRGDR